MHGFLVCLGVWGGEGGKVIWGMGGGGGGGGWGGGGGAGVRGNIVNI